MKGVSVSRYLVEAHETCTDLETAKKKYETGPIVEKLESIRTEIWHIGHNVNQIARVANESGVVPEGLAEAQTELSYIRELLVALGKDFLDRADGKADA